jgi:hypothetical protein
MRIYSWIDERNVKQQKEMSRRIRLSADWDNCIGKLTFLLLCSRVILPPRLFLKGQYNEIIEIDIVLSVHGGVSFFPISTAHILADLKTWAKTESKPDVRGKRKVKISPDCPFYTDGNSPCVYTLAKHYSSSLFCLFVCFLRKRKYISAWGELQPEGGTVERSPGGAGAGGKGLFRSCTLV